MRRNHKETTMTRTGLQRLLSSLVVATGALLAGCRDDAPVAPAPQVSLPVSATAYRAPELAACSKLAAPADSKLAFHVFAKGVQIYRWTGTSWGFVGPEATLSADAGGRSVVGIHYEGPKWESNDGGKVTGTVIDRCTPNPNAIQWLSLKGVAEGGGIFHRVVYIQRVNTAGGKEPARAGDFVGEVARVPYTTEYYFYRGR